MSRGRRLVEALAAAVARYSPDDQKQKCSLLESLERCAIRHPGTLLRFHEALCFLQAHPDDARVVELVWSRFDDEDRLDETLSLLATAAEGDAFSEGGMGWRRWLRVAKGGRRLSDLAVVLELFERTGLPQETRDWLFESVALPILWRPRGPGASRTLARLPCRRVFFHHAGLDMSAGDLVDALRRPPPLVRAPRDR